MTRAACSKGCWKRYIQHRNAVKMSYSSRKNLATLIIVNRLFYRDGLTSAHDAQMTIIPLPLRLKKLTTYMYEQYMIKKCIPLEVV